MFYVAAVSWRAKVRAMVRHDGVFWRRFAYLGCTYAPEWFKRSSPPLIGAIMFALVGRNRRGAVENLRRVLHTQSALRAHLAGLQTFADFARCFAETTEAYGPRPVAVRIDLPDADPLAEALESGRGVVVVTGHFGNWDIAAKTLCQYGRAVNAVMAREVNATTHDFVRAARENAGIRVIYSDSSTFSAFNMLHALRRNEIVAMQLDRSGSAEATRPVPFFGAPAPFAVGPFVLGRLAQAPIIPVFIPRIGRRHYAVRTGGCFRIPRESRADGFESAMAGVASAFESIVREFPTQWFQFAPFWSGAAAALSAETGGDDDTVLEARIGA